MSTYAENFDALNDGDLNGQGGFSGDVSFDVQTSVVQAGAKAISCAGGNTTIYKNIIASNGILGIYIRSSDLTSPARCPTVSIFKNGGRLADVVLWADGKIYFDGHNNSYQIGNCSANTWYFLELEFDNTTFKARGRVDGGSWSVWDFFQDLSSSVNIDQIEFLNQNYSTGSGTCYYDGLSLTGVADSGPANLKTINALAKASVKTYKGLAIASVKSFNGLT